MVEYLTITTCVVRFGMSWSWNLLEVWPVILELCPQSDSALMDECCKFIIDSNTWYLWVTRVWCAQDTTGKHLSGVWMHWYHPYVQESCPYAKVWYETGVAIHWLNRCIRLLGFFVTEMDFVAKSAKLFKSATERRDLKKPLWVAVCDRENANRISRPKVGISVW